MNILNNKSSIETKANSMEYIEEENPNNSKIIINNNENNNIFLDNLNNNKIKNEKENLKIAKIGKRINYIKPVKFNIPPDLKKTFIFTIILTIIGIILIICGIIKAIFAQRIMGGIMFWILSILVLIPGGFYSFQFYKAKISKQNYERQEILDSIPRL